MTPDSKWEGTYRRAWIPGAKTSAGHLGAWLPQTQRKGQNCWPAIFKTIKIMNVKKMLRNWLILKEMKEDKHMPHVIWGGVPGASLGNWENLSSVCSFEVSISQCRWLHVLVWRKDTLNHLGVLGCHVSNFLSPFLNVGDYWKKHTFCSAQTNNSKYLKQILYCGSLTQIIFKTDLLYKIHNALNLRNTD